MLKVPVHCLRLPINGQESSDCGVDQIEGKQPTATRVKNIRIYTVKIFTWHCSNYASKTKEPPLCRSSMAALNPSVSSMSMMRVGSWFHSLIVL